MKFILGIFLVLLTFYSSAQTELDSILNVLDSEIENRDKYDTKREIRINMLKEFSSSIEMNYDEEFKINQQLIEEYRTYKFDSALSYLKKNYLLAQQLNNNERITKTLLDKAKLLASSGGYIDALDILDHIDSVDLDSALEVEYYMAYRKVWEDVSFYTPIPENYVIYNDLQNKYTDSLLMHINPDSKLYFDILEKEYRDNRDLEKCLQLNTNRLINVKIGSPEYSLIAFQRSLIFELDDNQELRKRFLALSAISDIRASIKDNASLTKLATLLFEDDDIERSYHYIKFSFQDAEFYNSRLRFIEISNIFPIITAAYQARIDAQNSELRNLITLITILLVIVLVSIIAIFSQVNKLKKARNELKSVNQSLHLLNNDLKLANDQLESLNHSLYEANHVKSKYIAHFLTICSDYIDKLDIYRRRVKKMVVTRKFQELLDGASSQEFLTKEVDEFYKTFDQTFLDLYPKFIEQLNNLLQNDAKIEPKSGELNTELRIFALVRLGIVDSSQIARLLRYSVNTIYNYRVKVKNKAAGSRDEFEEKVMNIDAF